jgi:hypothetical protein
MLWAETGAMIQRRGNRQHRSDGLHNYLGWFHPKFHGLGHKLPGQLGSGSQVPINNLTKQIPDSEFIHWWCKRHRKVFPCWETHSGSKVRAGSAVKPQDFPIGC